MCEYRGCQQITTIAELCREHDVVVARVARIQSGLAGHRRDGIAIGCRQILAILAPHTVVEEEGLFPEMTDELPDHIKVLRVEHCEIEKVLGEVTDGVPDDSAWLDLLDAVVHLLRDHILTEQHGVIPAALVALDAGQWERIEALRARILAKSVPASAGDPDGG